MSAPEGKLTPAQHELMELVWAAGEAGASIGELWQQVSEKRDVTRTTVQNLVERLYKRRWLKRRKAADGFRFLAATGRVETAQLLTADFVDEFFAGSASEMVLSLFGSKRITRAELSRLRDLLDTRLGKKNSAD